jgi:hypothetical protein
VTRWYCIREMLSRALPPVLALTGALACVAFFGVPTAGCLDVAEGGTSPSSGSGSGSGADAGEGGAASTDAGSGLMWGCADNGTNCQCYSPAPAEYTQTECITYQCCYADSYVTELGATQHTCACTNDVSCVSMSATAQRVTGCPH